MPSPAIVNTSDCNSPISVPRLRYLLLTSRRPWNPVTGSCPGNAPHAGSIPNAVPLGRTWPVWWTLNGVEPGSHAPATGCHPR